MNDKILTTVVGLRPRLSCWDGRATDESLGNEVRQSHNIGSRKDASVRVRLVSEEFIGTVTAHYSQARQFIYQKTLPWSNDGDRVIGTSKYQEFEDAIVKLDMEGRQLVKAFLIDKKDSIMADARARLNGAFDEALFPPWDRLSEKFAITLNVFPIQHPNDARIEGLTEAVTNRVKDEATRAVNERVEGTVADILTDMRLIVSDLKVKCSEDKKGTKYKFLIERALAAADHAELDITGNPVIASAAKRLRQAVEGLTTDTLQRSHRARNTVIEVAEEVAKSINEVM